MEVVFGWSGWFCWGRLVAWRCYVLGAFGGCIVHQSTPGLASPDVSIARQCMMKKRASLPNPTSAVFFGLRRSLCTLVGHGPTHNFNLDQDADFGIRSKMQHVQLPKLLFWTSAGQKRTQCTFLRPHMQLYPMISHAEHRNSLKLHGNPLGG